MDVRDRYRQRTVVDRGSLTAAILAVQVQIEMLKCPSTRIAAKRPRVDQFLAQANRVEKRVVGVVEDKTAHRLPAVVRFIYLNDSLGEPDNGPGSTTLRQAHVDDKVTFMHSSERAVHLAAVEGCVGTIASSR